MIAGVRTPKEVIQIVLEDEGIENPDRIAKLIDKKLALALASLSPKPFKGYGQPGDYVLIGIEKKKLSWMTFTNETHTN